MTPPPQALVGDGVRRLAKIRTTWNPATMSSTSVRVSDAYLFLETVSDRLPSLSQLATREELRVRLGSGKVAVKARRACRRRELARSSLECGKEGSTVYLYL